MKFVTLILLTLFQYNCSLGQDYIYPLEAKSIEWKLFEKVVSSEKKDEIIKALPNEFEYYRHIDKYSPTISDLRNDIHVIDINNDGLDDFIFDGFSGGEPNEISIYINTTKNYLKVFTDYQKIKKFDWENSMLKRLYIHDYGCCGDNGRINKIFEVSYFNNIPNFEQKYQSWYFDVTEFPSKLFDKPKEFEIIDTNIEVRFSPCVCDSALDSFMEPTGNKFFETLPPGTKGRALGYEFDKSKQTWWFVEIYPFDNWITNDEKYPTRILGWISRKSIKK